MRRSKYAMALLIMVLFAVLTSSAYALLGFWVVQPSVAPSFTDYWASVTASSNQSIATDGATHAISFPFERTDTDTLHDPASNNSRLTAQHAGAYLIACSLEFGPADLADELHITLNGVLTDDGNISASRTEGSGATITRRKAITTLYHLAASDYVECGISSNHSGGNVDNVKQGIYSPDFSMYCLTCNNSTGKDHGNVAADVWNSANQAITTAVQTTLLFDTERLDTASIHSTVSNTGNLVAPQAGVYFISCDVRWTATNNSYAIFIYQGSTKLSTIKRSDNTDGSHQSTSTIATLATSDIVTCQVLHTNGSNVNVLGSTNPTSFAMACLTCGNEANYSIRAYNSANISTAGSGATVPLTFDSESFDTDTMHSTSSNTGRITIQHTGIYVVGCHIEWGTVGAGTSRVSLRANGVTFLASYQEYNVTNMMEATTLRPFRAGEYVECTVSHQDAASANVNRTASSSPEFMAACLNC